MGKLTTIKISLGDREYDLLPLPVVKSRAVRQLFADRLQPIIKVVGELPTTEFSNLEAMSRLVDGISISLVGSFDLMLDVICEYSPDVKRDRNHLEQIATDDEVLFAFLEVVKLLFPFGLPAIRAILGISTGLPLPTTLKS